MLGIDTMCSAETIIARLFAIDRLAPVLDRERVEEALAAHLTCLGLPPMPIYWFADAMEGYKVAMATISSKAWESSIARAEIRALGAGWRSSNGPWRKPVMPWLEHESTVMQLSRRRAEAMQAPVGQDSAGFLIVNGAASILAGQANVPDIARWGRIWSTLLPAVEAGLFCFWVGQRQIIAVPRPEMHIVNNQLHCENGPAVKWADGQLYWFWRGVEVTCRVVEYPQILSFNEILAEPNIEIRRVMMERFGSERLIREGKAQRVHRDDFGTLWRLEMPRDETVMMVEVLNSTPEPDGSFKNYWLRVHLELRPLLDNNQFGAAQELTAKNAVASTFGLCGEEYNPTVET